MAEVSKQVNFDHRFIESLLLDESNIQAPDYTAGRELLRSYANIPDAQIAAHVASIQRRAYKLCPYPCIGLLRFLICSLSEHDHYPAIISRLQAGARYLDIGCCFAQDIRRLAFDGAPTQKCIGVDLEPGFFPLSEALFLDQGRLSARLYGADIFDQDDPIWGDLHGSVDIVHVSSFFHLFSLRKQKHVARMICRLVKPVPESLVLGLQLAAVGQAENIPIVNQEEPSYCHSPATMQSLWDVAGQEVGLEEYSLSWNLEVKERKIPEAMRVGLLSNPNLCEVLWIARTFRREVSS